MRAARSIGGEAPNIGVYLKKGHTPRSIDHRAWFAEMFDTATSSAGTVETGAFHAKDHSSPEEISTVTATAKPARFFKDSLGICLQSTGSYFTSATGEDAALDRLIALLNAVTGWDYSREEMDVMGMRTANMLRMFDLRQGIDVELEYPSPRYGSAPSAAGGQSVMIHWKQMLQNFYAHMGWDSKTGVPLPETLRKLGLEHLLKSNNGD